MNVCRSQSRRLIVAVREWCHKGHLSSLSLASVTSARRFRLPPNMRREQHSSSLSAKLKLNARAILSSHGRVKNNGLNAASPCSYSCEAAPLDSGMRRVSVIHNTTFSWTQLRSHNSPHLWVASHTRQEELRGGSICWRSDFNAFRLGPLFGGGVVKVVLWCHVPSC